MMANSDNADRAAPRVVLFLTQEVAADIPGGETQLACLLPLGTATFLERLMDSCALAGIRQVDLVVSTYPEALRAVLLDGAPWGIALRWHHAKEPASPYRVLRGIARDPLHLTVIGHGHRWVSSRILQEMLKAPAMALEMDAAFGWCGWFSAEGASIGAIGPHVDYDGLATTLRRIKEPRCILAGIAECARADSAQSLLQAQRAVLDASQEAAVPATWLRAAWGAASPDAVISPRAQVEGPALIGPGCVIEAGAQVGAGVVLARDVYLAAGARVNHSLVLPNTYVGGKISLENSIAQGHSIQSLRWDVRTVLEPSDALMAPLKDHRIHTTSRPAQLLALVAAVATLPLMLVALGVQRLHTGQVLWQNQRVVTGRAADTGRLDSTVLRLPHGPDAVHRCVAGWGALVDIVQGRRHWFGMRPRSEAEWHALGHDWQNLFNGTPIGLLYAPAWQENNQCLNLESYAAADAFMVVQKSTLKRLRMVCAHRTTSA